MDGQGAAEAGEQRNGAEAAGQAEGMVATGLTGQRRARGGRKASRGRLGTMPWTAGGGLGDEDGGGDGDGGGVPSKRQRRYMSLNGSEGQEGNQEAVAAAGGVGARRGRARRGREASVASDR